MTHREARQGVVDLHRAGFINAYAVAGVDGRWWARLSTTYGARVCYELDDVRAVLQTVARVGHQDRGTS